MADISKEPDTVIELKEEIRALHLNLRIVKEKEIANEKKIDDLIAFLYKSGAGQYTQEQSIKFLIEAYGAKGNRKDFSAEPSKFHNPLDVSTPVCPSVNTSSK